MSRIRMRTTAAGPRGTLYAGHEYTVSDDRALELLAGDACVLLEDVPRAASLQPPEHAVRRGAEPARPTGRRGRGP